MRMITNGSTIFKHHLFLTDIHRLLNKIMNETFVRPLNEIMNEIIEQDFRKTGVRLLNEHGRTI